MIYVAWQKPKDNLYQSYNYYLLTGIKSMGLKHVILFRQF